MCLFYTSACLLYSNRMQLMFYWCCKMFIRKLFSSVINIHFINEIEKLHCCAIPHSTAQMLSQPCRDWQGPTLPRKSTTGPKYSSSNGPNNLQTSSTWQFCFFFKEKKDGTGGQLYNILSEEMTDSDWSHLMQQQDVSCWKIHKIKNTKRICNY